MKTYIFFDTNILEIPNRKDISQFQFSSSYYQTLKIIEKYNLSGDVIPLVPCIVIEELLEHYKSNYKSKVQSGNEGTIRLNEILKGVAKSEFIFEPLYEIDEYMEYIEQSKNDYLKKWAIETVDCPNELNPIVERAVNKKNPFVVAHKGEKKYSDAGFKDVVIWESILNHKYETNDVIIFFTDDNGFYNPNLEKELTNKFIILGAVDTLSRKLFEIFGIDEELFEYAEFIKSDYFEESIAEELEFIFSEYSDIGLINIDLNIEGAKVTRELVSEEPKEIENAESRIIVTLKPTFFYKMVGTETNMKLDIETQCIMQEMELELISFSDEFDFEEGTIIEDNRGETSVR